MANFLDFLWNGSPPPSTTSKSTATTTLPAYYQDYQKGVLSKANAVAANPFQTFPGPRLAGFDPMQTQAYQGVAANQGNWKPALQQAQGLTQNAATPFDQGTFDQFKSPYITDVVNRIAQLGGRNLTENLLPGVNQTFTGSGQFGSSRHADFTNRAVRDANESILGQQATALQAAQDAAMGNYQTAMNRQLNAGQQLGALSQQGQQQGYLDTANLEAAGKAQQQQAQGNLDLGYQDFLEQRDWSKNQTDWLNNILKGQNVPTSTQRTETGPGNVYGPSGLATLAGIGSLFKGLRRGGPVRGALAYAR